MDGVRATRKIHSKLNGQRDRGRERGAFGSDWEQEQLTEAEGIRITHQDYNKEGQLTHRQNEEAADARAAGSPLHRAVRGRRIQRREIERELLPAAAASCACAVRTEEGEKEREGRGRYAKLLLLGGRRIGGAVGEWYLWSISALCFPFPPKKSQMATAQNAEGEGGRVRRTEAAAVVGEAEWYLPACLLPLLLFFCCFCFVFAAARRSCK